MKYGKCIWFPFVRRIGNLVEALRLVVFALLICLPFPLLAQSALDDFTSARQLYASGDREAALTVAMKALKKGRQEFGENHSNVGFIQNDVAKYLFQLNRSDEALVYSNEAVRILDTQQGIAHSELISVKTNKAVILSALCRYRESIPIFEDNHAELGAIGVTGTAYRRNLSSLTIAYLEDQ